MRGTGCVVCSVTKGKRVCRLNDHALICPVCCARIRNPTCEGCGYWAQAIAYGRDKAEAPRAPHFVATIDPEVDAEVDRALAMAEVGRVEAAEPIVSRLLDQHPDLYMVQFAMGVVFALQGR